MSQFDVAIIGSGEGKKLVYASPSLENVLA